MVARMLNADCKNLGFSSSALGDPFVAEYIAELEMSAFVMDYDYNSSLNELAQNHYNFYKTIRDAQPELPIILVSRPCYLEKPTTDMLNRIAVIEGTYKRAVEEGDKNIYFINGSEFFPKGLREMFTIDTTHPNDLGQCYMGLAVYKVLNSVYKYGTVHKTIEQEQKVVFSPVSDDAGMNNVKYVKVTDLDTKYLTDEGEYVFVSALEEHIQIGGIVNPEDNNGEYYRLDATKKSTYAKKSEGVARTAQYASGVTLRFCTNADSFVLRVTMGEGVYDAINMTARGAYGFDVYIGSGTNRIYCGANMQMMFNTSQLNETIALPSGYKEIMVNLPLFAQVKEISIGLPKDAEIGTPPARAYKQICFYGSSITEGASASRPGNAYTNMVARMLNADCKNLGFSGAARGESFVAEYIARLDMSAFVMDYDYDSALEELQENHYNFYKTIRDAQPNLPIILISRPSYGEEPTDDTLSRVAVIEETYKKAIAAGDKNIYFINGSEILPKGIREMRTIDGTRPNDLGHYYIGLSVYEVLNSILDTK